MKRLFFLFTLLAVLLLSGCAGNGAQNVPGWDESWTRFGGVAAMEPVEGFALNENMDALAPSGIYYADWTCGEARDFAVDDEQTVTAYDAQFYLLLAASGDAQHAESEANAWLAREEQNYETGETVELAVGGRTYAVLPLLASAEGNPYTHGAAAFFTHGAWAVSAELLCADGFAGDAQETLARFLAGLHFNEETGG